jgi:hypothetical protein
MQAQQLGWKQYAGIALFTLGIGLEIVPEETRKRFKAKPENKGKVDSTGGWRYVPSRIRLPDADLDHLAASLDTSTTPATRFGVWELPLRQ